MKGLFKWLMAGLIFVFMFTMFTGCAGVEKKILKVMPDNVDHFVINYKIGASGGQWCVEVCNKDKQCLTGKGETWDKAVKDLAQGN